MHEITVSGHFDGAHRLYDYIGKCANIHGHSWIVEVTLGSDSLNSQGMVCDFHDLKKVLNSVIDDYDHILINEVAPFDEISPTAENLAMIIFGRLKVEIAMASISASLSSVTIHESQTAKAVYRENTGALT